MSSRVTTEVDTSNLHQRAAALLADGFVVALVAAHDDGDAVRMVYTFVAGEPDRRVELVARLDARDPCVPSLSDLSFAAGRFEREVHDLFGVVPEGHAFLRPLVRHAHWPDDWHPMRHNAGRAPVTRSTGATFPFVEVAGDGVYEIPVGPIHAGLIEPGHFRFSVIGETILKMTARLWFLHRGVERMFEGMTANDAVNLAEKISGDSAVGHGLAFTVAVEEALGLAVPDEAKAARAVLLELERLYNHVGDLGAMCNDVSFGVAHARAMVIRETLLRVNESITGHRLLRGAIAPGRTTLGGLPTNAQLDGVHGEVEALVELVLAHSVVVDRFEGTAVLAAAEARAMGVLGPVARASGQLVDARREHPFAPTSSPFLTITQTSGDVLARFNQRVEEIRASIGLIRSFTIDAATDTLSVPVPHAAASGLGLVEGWRGRVAYRVELDDAGALTRCRVVDPSFFNWPALAVSLVNTIVPDFPLANKSFNLSYAGNDL
jgi:Ni,Fe-hydrogenase III large subunit/Ni,Fe-hydrogenase III component G